MPTWLQDLQRALGEQQVVTDATECEFYSQDVFSQGSLVDAVVRPRDADQLARACALLTAAGVAVHARGGGLSYTEGYLAVRKPAVALDLTALNRIIEINVEDRYVRVETGVTWSALDTALAAHGLRTPYWGPLSGLRSTVGGALSQGSVFLGSGEHGAVGDSVLGLDVLSAGGELLLTGAAAAAHTPPFMRWFGPDLTGVFIGDAGSLGIKLRASLRLIPRPACLDFLSFEFDAVESVMAAMSEVSRRGLAAECFAFDPFLAEVRLQRQGLLNDAKTLFDVVRQSGLTAGARLVSAGRGFVGAQKWSVHLSLEADTDSALRSRVKEAQRLLAASGRQIEASIPRALRAAPFAAPNSILGPGGERWVPVHGIFAHSRAAPGFEACADVLQRHAAAMTEHGIRAGHLITTVASQGLLVEPVFFWPDSHTAYHKRVVEPAYRQRAGEPVPNAPGRQAMVHIKRDMADAMRNAGAVHFQIGRFYRWREGRSALALQLHDTLKAAMDPQGLLNPGVLA